MNEDTIHLLKECNSGCKMATNSMEQVLPYIGHKGLQMTVQKYNDQHIHLGDACHQMLNELHEDEKDPKSMANTFSKLSTGIKLKMDHSAHEVADMMIDGCNMGIKSLSQNLNQYPTASAESVELTQKLIKTEQAFMNDLLTYL